MFFNHLIILAQAHPKKILRAWPVGFNPD